jgi:putative membrane protein
MNTLLYLIVIAATFIGLSRGMGLIGVDGWRTAILAAVVLAVVNAIVKPILFVLTLPLTIVTLGLFLLVLNAITLKITAALVPGLTVGGWGSTIIASLILSVVGMIWKSITKEEKAGKN